LGPAAPAVVREHEAVVRVDPEEGRPAFGRVVLFKAPKEVHPTPEVAITSFQAHCVHLSQWCQPLSRRIVSESGT
jgi:hypothetical protein